MHTHTYTYVHRHTFINMRAYAYVHAHTYTREDISMYTFIHTHKQTYTHTNTLTTFKHLSIVAKAKANRIRGVCIECTHGLPTSVLHDFTEKKYTSEHTHSAFCICFHFILTSFLFSREIIIGEYCFLLVRTVSQKKIIAVLDLELFCLIFFFFCDF